MQLSCVFEKKLLRQGWEAEQGKWKNLQPVRLAYQPPASSTNKWDGA
jgi:hypothetical protein